MKRGKWGDNKVEVNELLYKEMLENALGKLQSFSHLLENRGFVFR